MDLTNSNYFEPPPLFPSQGEASLKSSSNGFYRKNKDRPFEESFPDPLCKLNLKETSEFVKAFPMANNVINNNGGGSFYVSTAHQSSSSSVTRSMSNIEETPTTPGRPIFSFSTSGNLSKSRKSFPSKWDDAEKWLINGSSFHYSPAFPQGFKLPDQPSKVSHGNHRPPPQQEVQVFSDKSRVTEEKVSTAAISSFLTLGHHNAVPTSADVLLKDKFTNEAEPNFGCLEPMKEGFVFGKAEEEAIEEEVQAEVQVQHRDIGTEMTPLGSCTTSRCHTPFKSSSPARHNTPANRSGPLVAALSSSSINSTTFAKLQLETSTQYDSVGSNWNSKEEEEEEISKSLRHFDMSNNCTRKSAEDEEKTKCCLRYQREEATIQAWVNLQNAKAEAQSRKLEVKIEKMRWNLEEKIMKRMSIVRRRAEELRLAAELQHNEQIERSTETAVARKMIKRRQQQEDSHFSLFTRGEICGCFPCSNH